MLHRREILLAGGTATLLAALTSPARAQALDKATAFIQQTGGQLVAVVNGPQSLADKRVALTRILDAAVAVDQIAQFCLGRFWRQASDDQKRRYIAAFHQVLVSNISTRLGDYVGLTLNVLKGRIEADQAIVPTDVVRPNATPARVEWVIDQPATAPKIVDVVAEGTSLRLTQRQDYASFLSQNANNIDALIQAMLKKATAAA